MVTTPQWWVKLLAYPLCHCERPSTGSGRAEIWMRLNTLRRTAVLRRRDCRATLAMTKWVRMSGSTWLTARIHHPSPCYNRAMVADGETTRRRRRGGRPGDAPDPATDGSADADRRGRQSDLRRILRETFPERNRDALLPALHLLQHEHGHLPEWALQVVGWHLRVPASESTAPPHPIRNCASGFQHGTPLPSARAWRAGWAGGEELLAAARRELAASGDSSGDTSINTSIDTTACAFICGVAPAAGVDGVGWAA